MDSYCSERTREEIIVSLKEMNNALFLKRDSFLKTRSVEDYLNFVRISDDGKMIWTDAFQRAIDENESVYVPYRDGGYYIDRTIVVRSRRRIIADRLAHIRKVPEMNTLLLRNEHLSDGSHYRISGENADEYIFISGGIWEDTGREWTFHHGLYDSENSMPGISACMAFNNLRGLVISDVKIIRAGGFGIQIGDLNNAVIERIEFENTVADGVHINGNTKNVIVRDISGSVGDDIVAFNMYDWSASSVCFGPIENLLCENITLSREARYKAIRILPGKYFYDDGSISDCYIKDVIIHGVRGVNTFKFYFQTPPYKIGESSEGGESGWGDNIFLEDIEMDLYAPIDAFDEYLNGDAVQGSFAAFEFGSLLGRVFIENVNVSIYKDKYPMSYFACVGPKSIRRGDREIFDPHVNSALKELTLKNVTVNGRRIVAEDREALFREIVFDSLYGDGVRSIGRFEKIIFV